jgi:two-component system OmpR family response regulator
MRGAATQQALRDAANAVDWVYDGETALLAMSSTPYEAMLLDLGLPGRDGLSVLQAARRAGYNLPVIIVTARDDADGRIRGLDLGADDYLVKPFATDELLARLRAVARRRGGHAQGVFDAGTVRLDPTTREASFGGNTARLSAREFALMHALLLRPGAVLSRSELEDLIYGWNAEVESNAVEYLIHCIRKKLGTDAIKNVRGVGWVVDRIRDGDARHSAPMSTQRLPGSFPSPTRAPEQ